MQTHPSTIPQPPFKWDYKPEDFSLLAEKLISDNRATLNKIANLPPRECNFDTARLCERDQFRSLATNHRSIASLIFQLELANAEAAMADALEPLAFYQIVCPAKELRDASNAAEARVRGYIIESAMRSDIHHAKLNARKNIREFDRADKQLTPEMSRLVEKMVLDGIRAGLDLPEKEREELKRLKEELSLLCLEFNKNMNEENGVITFTKEELKGVPEDVISGYIKHSIAGEKDDHTNSEVYKVTLTALNIYPIFRFAEGSETRKRAYEAYESRLENNVPILAKVVALRRHIAKLLGYATWADYITELNMAKNAEGVQTFIDDLEAKLRPLGLKERKTFIEMKRKECEANGRLFDGQLNVWDYWYYDRKYLSEKLNLDDSEVKEYFPVSVVIPAILEIYQDLLGVKFEEVKGDGALVWHPDVQLFAVWEKNAQDFIGYCYLDLFPREAKYDGEAVWCIIQGYERPFAKRNYPVTAMVTNLTKPSPGKPALMPHEDVVTFFHEMGHVFHGLLSRTQYSRFHGMSVACDFVEAPSQMLENWCWEPIVLEKVSSHHQTQKPLSQELIKKIIDSRYVNVGLSYLRDLFYAKFDLHVHTAQADEDYTQLWNTMQEEMSLLKGGRLCPGQGAFGHLTGGYDAGYYGYAYSLVFAADMYDTVFKAAPLDPARGKMYRDKILKPGASRDEMASLEDFLGRAPNNKAFMRQLFGSAGVGNKL